MVDLPTVPDRIVTSVAPQSSVSRQDIIGGSNLMAKAIGDVADAQMEIATRQAKEQAAEDLQNQKVTLNADGSVQVVNPANSMIFGRAGEQYHAAVQAGTIAQHDNVISEQMNKLHQEYPTDPAAFKVAADSFKAKYLQDHGGGQVGLAIQQRTDSVQTQHQLAITNTSAQIDVTNQQKSIQANIADQKNTLQGLARQPGGTDTPQFKAAIEQMGASYQALTTNPLFRMPQDQVDLEVKNFKNLLQGEATVAHIDETFTKKGKGEAQKALTESILQNPNLAEVDRTRLYTQGLSRLSYLTGDAKATIDANRQITTELEAGLAKGTVKPEDPAVGLAIQRARDIGDTEGAQRITAAAAVKQQMRGVNALPDHIRDEVLGKPGGTVNTALPPEARGLLDTIAKTESAGRYNVRYGGAQDKTFQDFTDHPRVAEPITSGPDVGKTSSAAGRYQFIGSTWDMQAKKLGLKDFSPANQDAAAWDLAQTEYKTRTGKDLLTTLRSGDTADVLPSLSGQWSSLPGGRQPAQGFQSNLAAADAAMKFTPQERAFYERHLTNLTGPGGVDNPDGSRSTLFQTTVEHAGKFYTIPTVFDGKILWDKGAEDPAAAAIEKVKEIGWEKFPSYKSEAEAEARYQQMHDFIAKDTMAYKQATTRPARTFNGFTPEQVQQNPFLISAYVRTLSHDPELRVQSARQTAEAVSKGIANGILPNPNAVAEVNQAAALYPDKLGPVADEMNGKLKGQQIAQLPQEQRDQVVEAYKRATDGQDVHHINVAAAALAQVDASDKNMREHPYDEAAQRGWIKPATPIDPSQPPEAITSAIVERAAMSARIGTLNHSPNPPLLDKDEMPKLQAALQGPNGPATLGLIGEGLKPDERNTLLGEKGFVDSVTGMMSSKDPVRMTSAMAFVDKVWRGNAADAEAKFGSAAVTRLQAWQALRDTFSPPELAERLNASDDPATLAARKAAGEQAEAEVKGLTPADMAYKMGTGWPGIGRLTGSTPSAPFDSIKGGELAADYRSTYTALRTYGVDADKASALAVQRLQASWGVSQAAGNQVMKNPPERSYPQVNGSHDWLQTDLTDWVTKKAGPQFVAGPRTLEAGIGGVAQSRNWQVEGMISDGQTQAEIAAGRPPSYQVAIKKADGTLDIVSSRIAFDPSNHIAAYGAGLEQKRQAVNTARDMSSGMPQP